MSDLAQMGLLAGDDLLAKFRAVAIRNPGGAETYDRVHETIEYLLKERGDVRQLLDELIVSADEDVDDHDTVDLVRRLHGWGDQAWWHAGQEVARHEKTMGTVAAQLPLLDVARQHAELVAAADSELGRRRFAAIVRKNIVDVRVVLRHLLTDFPSVTQHLGDA